MLQDWLGSTWEQLGYVVVSTLGIYLAVIAYVRLAGLRSFAKMTSTDLAMTLAVGSLIAGTATSSSTSLLNGVVAIGVLFSAQVLIALARRKTGLGRLIDNTPVLLMLGPDFIEANLRRTRVRREDVRAKLRAANVLELSSVRAVVLETTGDISVLHGEGPLDPRIIEGVSNAGLALHN